MTIPEKPVLRTMDAEGHNGTADTHVFHASLRLFLLLEKRPRPDNPDWVDIGCWMHSNVKGMMVYLSPLDAMNDLQERNAKGAKYEIYPFESIDPRDFIQEHGGWFTVCLVYGFAAREKRLVLNDQGNLMSLVNITHFRITDEMSEHFHLEFGAATHAWLERLHIGAGLLDYGSLTQDLSTTSFVELNQTAKEALRRVKSPDSGKNKITHAGIYDTVELKWRFVALAGNLMPSNQRAS